MTKQIWVTPSLTDYGSAAKITNQTVINVQKNLGSGDSVILTVVGNPPVGIGNSTTGGSILSITCTGPGVSCK
jgi:hypothetical protein